MELSPWTVYWILQLDSIGSVAVNFVTLSVLAAIFSLAGTVATFAFASDSSLAPDERRLVDKLQSIAIRVFKVSSLTLLLLGAVCALLPSSKSMAAIVILPAVVNNETVQSEAGEIYNLAKDALADLAGREDAE